MELDGIQAAIESVPNILKPAEYSNDAWTKTIKREILKLANEEFLLTCASGIEGTHWGEWLFDVTVIKYRHIENFDVIGRVELALESEWDARDEKILEDFQKLLTCNSKLKVFIFQNNLGIFQFLKENQDIFEISNGQFLIAMWSSKEQAFLFHQRAV